MSTEHGMKRRGIRVAAAVAMLAIALAAAVLFVRGWRPGAPEPTVAETRPTQRYDVEYPQMGYSTRPTSGRVARLAAGLESGTVRLEATASRGYLDALLAALDIDPASQLLVFSRTSLQVGGIGPRTPRAIYFNDDTYVAWVQGAASLEIASMDPSLGPVLHTFAQPDRGSTGLERQLDRCLRCHDSYSLTGGGVPRFLLGSGYIGEDGELVSHEAWILTSPSTPLRNRWGGWYVSGRHGDQVHLGNIVVGDPAELQNLESLRIGNLDDLTGMLDTEPYLTPYSDIVALLVIEHQVQVQNAISRVLFETTVALADAATSATLDGSGVGAAAASPAGADDVAGGPAALSIDERIDGIVEPLVAALLMAGEVELGAPIEGTSGFRAAFESRGPRDARGRSLRDLDLESRLFRYPLSYLIYSEAFDALPDPARRAIAGRLDDILSGRDTSTEFAHLSGSDREVIIEILRATKPGFLPGPGPGPSPRP